MRVLLALFVGILSGAAAHFLGIEMVPYVGVEISEVLTVLTPCVVLLLGNWMIAKVNGAWLTSRIGEIAVPQSVGILLLPGFFTFFGHEWEVLGGLATGVLSLPAVLIGSPGSVWLLRRMVGIRS